MQHVNISKTTELHPLQSFNDHLILEKWEKLFDFYVQVSQSGGK